MVNMKLKFSACIVPFFFEQCKDAVHLCPNCKAEVGRKNFIFEWYMHKINLVKYNNFFNWKLQHDREYYELRRLAKSINIVTDLIIKCLSEFWWSWLKN